jgi:hypothetical protein
VPAGGGQRPGVAADPARSAQSVQLGLALGADAEDVRLMAADHEAAALSDPSCPRLDLAGVDLLNPLAAVADEMVMVDRTAEPVHGLATVVAEDVDLAAVDELLQSAVDRGKPDAAAQLSLYRLGRHGLGRGAQVLEDGRSLRRPPCTLDRVRCLHHPCSVRPRTGTLGWVMQRRASPLTGRMQDNASLRARVPGDGQPDLAVTCRIARTAPAADSPL